MKRVSQKEKIQRIKRIRRIERSKSQRLSSVKVACSSKIARHAAARLKFERQLAVVGSVEGITKKVPRYGNRKVFEFPSEMDFEDNYNGTISMILKLRELEKFQFSRRPFYLEFEKLKSISPGALLVLAAELDCLYRLWSNSRKKPIAADSDRWDSGITALFSDFGIFDLINAAPVIDYTYGESLRAVKFRRGETQDGSVADALIKDIVGVSEKAPSERARLYEGLGEALANTLDHAYPNPYVSYPSTRIKAWWAGAIYDETSNITHFMVYDRGIGLPARIPDRNHEWYSEVLKHLLGTKNADADLIWAAIRSPRSGTLLDHRGEGLKQMAEVVDSHPGSDLRISSGQGLVSYFGAGKKELKSLNAPFTGTLVEWRIKHG